MTTTSSTILIIEDDADLADLYANVLKDTYQVRTAYSGKRGLERFDSDVDVVLLDRRMPGYSGDEVLRDIRSHEHDCPVAMITAIDPDSDIVDLPFDEYITKPVDQAELQETVERLITESESTHTSEILDTLGDQIARHLLSYLVDDTATAKELADATGYSLPTVYRRLNALNQAGLIEKQTQIQPAGNHVSRYTAIAEQVHVDILDDFETDVKRSKRPDSR